MSDSETITTTGFDARAQLSTWANGTDEWVRSVVRCVLSEGRPLTHADIDAVYDLFRQENALDTRTVPGEPPLALAASSAEADEVLRIASLSEITGVNALVSGAVIEPHEGLTILYGENGTGKTGYSRLFKSLAASRTADEVLGDVSKSTSDSQSALVAYTLGGAAHTFRWSGEVGVAPFTRMSIFDSPSVSFHVDADLEYVYVPATLVLFNHVSAAIHAVQARIEADIKTLGPGASTLLSRIPRDSTPYPLIEALGPATDLDALRALADMSADVGDRIAVLHRAVAALEAGTLSTTIMAQKRVVRVLTQAATLAATFAAFDVPTYNATLTRIGALEVDYEQVRQGLFAAADLPAAPDGTWTTFVEAGERYRQHLVTLDVHDEDRCLYCRQSLGDAASALVGKYGEYLADKIGADIAEAKKSLELTVAAIATITAHEVTAWVAELADQTDQPASYVTVTAIVSAMDGLRASVTSGVAVNNALVARIATVRTDLAPELTALKKEVERLEKEAANRTDVLVAKQRELTELMAAAELGLSWTLIETEVKNAKEADQLTKLAKPMPSLRRTVTTLSKTASSALMNQSFGTYFAEECALLRAPALKVEYLGREGTAKRRKVLVKKHRPSKVLSEGEQKVLALADFLAEARLSGISAPVIFDDPVSSLDHRRINEVAKRISNLSQTAQVIVFTHDITFAMTLLDLMAKSKRCSFLHIHDEGGQKGQVIRESHPRWDTLKGLTKKINEAIEAAAKEEGESRAAHVRTGYGWVRSWCEVFTEIELLQGVTQRHQVAVHMTKLSAINGVALAGAVEPVVRIFETACRYIDSHSQPLTTLSVSPTLMGLEEHWSELQAARDAYLHADD